MVTGHVSPCMFVYLSEGGAGSYGVSQCHSAFGFAFQVFAYRLGVGSTA